MNEKMKSLAYRLGIVVLGVLGIGGVASALSGSFPIGIESCNNCSFSVSQTPVVGEAEQSLGASGTRYPNGLSADTTSPVAGELRGTTLTITGASSLSGTTTLGYTNNQLNTLKVTVNSNTTTVCSVLNDSGADRVITDTSLTVTGSTGAGGLSQFRAYVSATRADMNTTATSTLMKQAFIDVGVTDKRIFGGPVPTSYYVTSSPVLTTAVGTTTSTPVLWPAGWYANMTSTAITSSTGACVFSNYLF